jgi:D-beta-D-heptose 7-phosphate kinase/D-beta-D-heptose 1-phosphate adenosyltransferase
MAFNILRIIQDAQGRKVINPEDRYIEDIDTLVDVVAKLRVAECKIVLTSGTFDILHIGHSRYIRRAREHGDVLIVAVDDDEKARERKGEQRPIIPFDERIEMLAHTRYADILTKKCHDHPKWHIIKKVLPDVLIAVEGTYTDKELEGLKEFCGEVVVLPRQAETSTSAKTRKLVLDGADILTRILSEELPERFAEILKSQVPALIQDAYQKMKDGDK